MWGRSGSIFSQEAKKEVSTAVLMHSILAFFSSARVNSGCARISPPERVNPPVEMK